MASTRDVTKHTPRKVTRRELRQRQAQQVLAPVVGGNQLIVLPASTNQKEESALSSRRNNTDGSKTSRRKLSSNENDTRSTDRKQSTTTSTNYVTSSDFKTQLNHSKPPSIKNSSTKPASGVTSVPDKRDSTRKPVNTLRMQQSKTPAKTSRYDVAKHSKSRWRSTEQSKHKQTLDVIADDAALNVDHSLDEVERRYFDDFQDEDDRGSYVSYSDEDFCADDELDDEDLYTETVTAEGFEDLAQQQQQQLPPARPDRTNTFSLPDLRGGSSLVGSSNHSSVSVHSEGASSRPLQMTLQERFGATKEELSLPEIASISQGSSNDETSEDSYTEPLTPRSKAASKKHCSLPDIGHTPRLPPAVAINFITPRGVDVMFTDSESSPSITKSKGFVVRHFVLSR